MFALARFVGSGSWGGEQDPLMTLVTFWLGTSHGRCSRTVARDLEMRVLDDVNASSFAGFGCESFAGLSFIGFTDGDCLWDLSARQQGRFSLDDERF